jgi:hypothetical protein
MITIPLSTYIVGAFTSVSRYDGEESHVYVGQATDKEVRGKQKGPERDLIADWSDQVMRALNRFGNDIIAYKDMPAHRRLLVDSCEVSTTCDVLIMVC